MSRVPWFGAPWDGDPARHPAWLALRAALDQGDGDAVLALLRDLEIPWPPRGSRQVPRAVAGPPHPDLLARMVLDLAPAAGDDGPRLLLGPWSDALDPHQPLHRNAWLAGVGAAGFAVQDGDERAPYKSWLKDRTRPSDADRLAVVAVAEAPWMAWRLVAPEGDGWCLAPLLPIGPAWVPSEPVRLDHVGGVDGPPRVDGLLLARVLPGATPPAAACALVLPRVPTHALLTGWFARAALPQLAGRPELATEELLRRGGHHVVASAHRWWWAERS